MAVTLSRLQASQKWPVMGVITPSEPTAPRTLKFLAGPERSFRSSFSIRKRSAIRSSTSLPGMQSERQSTLWQVGMYSMNLTA